MRGELVQNALLGGDYVRLQGPKFCEKNFKFCAENSLTNFASW